VENKKEVAKLVLANMAIGSLGYGLRFWSIPRIPSVTHSIISYTGIFTTVLYSFYLGIEQVNVSKLGYLGLLAIS
jgi:drug/metabolite transporter (DMT)-like permease